MTLSAFTLVNIEPDLKSLHDVNVIFFCADKVPDFVWCLIYDDVIDKSPRPVPVKITNPLTTNKMQLVIDEEPCAGFILMLSDEPVLIIPILSKVIACVMALLFPSVSSVDVVVTHDKSEPCVGPVRSHPPEMVKLRSAVLRVANAAAPTLWETI